jgi:hypothetical protein
MKSKSGKPPMSEQMDPLKRAIAEAQTPEWREKSAKDQRFLSEVVYAGLTDLNSGFDSPGVSHYSPKDFLTIIDRCEALKVRIIGIEIFRVGPREVGFLGVEAQQVIPFKTCSADG